MTSKKEGPVDAQASASGGEAAPKGRTIRRRTRSTAAGSKPAESRPSRRRRTTRAAAEKKVEDQAVTARPLPRLLQRLRTEVAPAMIQEFGYTSPMRVPHPEKVVLNIGLGEALENARALESASSDLGQISGQKPVPTRAKQSIAGFKIRQGMAIGLKVTLRGRRMYEFLDRLFNSALPRVRDFQGVPREAFDGRGNYSLGISEHIIFPEIDYNSIDRIRGLQVAIGTSARTDREGLRLLELLGMPFARSQESTRAA